VHRPGMKIDYALWLEMRRLQRPTLGVALSGGGHRATLFGLGALLYLVDAGTNIRTISIASVSGGSITNAFVAQECNYQLTNSEEFGQVATRLASVVANRGLLSTNLITVVYVSVLVALAVVIFLCFALRPPQVGALLCAALVPLWAVIAGLRGTIMEMLFARLLFSKNGTRTRFKDAQAIMEHVFCATDLISTQPFYFSTMNGGHVYSHSFGFAEAESIGLHVAVRASAAFPGGFPPRRLNIRKLRFQRSSVIGVSERIKRESLFGKLPTIHTIYLADGGVWNNLATEWFMATPTRKVETILERDAPADFRSEELPDQLLVVNATAPVRPQKVGLLELPLIGELVALLRVMNVLYQSTVAPRLQVMETRRSAGDHQSPAAHKEPSPATFVVSIDRQICEIANDRIREHGASPDIKKRAQAFLDAYASWPHFLELPHEDLMSGSLSDLWIHCSRIPTTLSRLGQNLAIKLLLHGYLSTMERLSVDANHPLLPCPGRKRLMSMVSGSRGTELS